jgi:hypothetical protein
MLHFNDLRSKKEKAKPECNYRSAVMGINRVVSVIDVSESDIQSSGAKVIVFLGYSGFATR